MSSALDNFRQNVEHRKAHPELEKKKQVMAKKMFHQWAKTHQPENKEQKGWFDASKRAAFNK